MLASNGDKKYCNQENSKRPECQESTKTTSSNQNRKTSPQKSTHLNNRVIKKSTSNNISNKPKVISKLKDKATHFDTIDELRNFKIEKGEDVL